MTRSRVVVVEGAGDVGSAVAYALHTAGFAVVLVEGPSPLTTRRRMALSDAVFDGSSRLAGVAARRVEDAAMLEAVLDAGAIPLVVGTLPAGVEVATLVDARMRKRAEPADRRGEAPLVIGLGPGFAPGVNCHVAVETQHGDRLGDVIESGATRDYDGIPRDVAGTRRERHVHAGRDGVFHTTLAIGDRLGAGDAVGTVDGIAEVAVIAGILRGLLRNGLTVAAGTRIAEVVPEGAGVLIAGIGDRPRAIAGGVLRALRTPSPYPLPQWGRGS